MKTIDTVITQTTSPVCFFVCLFFDLVAIIKLCSNFLFSDVYDSAWWKECMGPVSEKLDRIGFLLCIDAVPAFHQKRKGSVSLKPGELLCLSQSPSIRYDTDNMMCWLLIPDTMSTASQIKYFKYVIKTELNPLYRHGVPGPDGDVKIKVFGVSLDLKEKEKFYNQVCLSIAITPQPHMYTHTHTHTHTSDRGHWISWVFHVFDSL